MRGEVRAGHSRANATELGARPAYRIDLRILCETREADLPDLAIRLAPERACGLAHCQRKHFAVNAGAAGLVGPVAQWLEPAAHNGLVAGSSPARPTNKSMILLYFSFFDELPRACGTGAQECWSLGASYSALTGEIGTLSLAANFVFPRAAGKSRERLRFETSELGSRRRSQRQRHGSAKPRRRVRCCALRGSRALTQYPIISRRCEVCRDWGKSLCSFCRRGSDGPLQTQGAPLIGEARREIHEARNAVPAWEVT